jgi:hypothetical protein
MIPDIPPIIFYLPFFVLIGAILVLAGASLILLLYLETLPPMAPEPPKETTKDE